MIIVTCTSCKVSGTYSVSEYLNYLAIQSGIGNSENGNENIKSLVNWHIIDANDKKLLNDSLDYSFVIKTVSRLLDTDEDVNSLKQFNLFDNGVELDKSVSKDEAIKIVDKVIKIINNKQFEKSFDYTYSEKVKQDKEDVKSGDIFFDEDDETYKIVNEDGSYDDAEFDDVYNEFSIADSYEIDFSDAEIIPYGEEIDDTSYVNNKYNLLASKTKVFSIEDYRISYSFNSSGFDVHISSKNDFPVIYGDLSIRNVKPSFKWLYSNHSIKNCYFNLSFNSTETLGVRTGKYKDYYLKFKDLDSSSFLSTLKSMVVSSNDEVEAIIPICEIKTPIPNVPFAFLNLTVGIKIYVSGKIEVVLYNSNNIGFEIKDGNFRIIKNNTNNLDSIIQASIKTAVALNASISATNYRLCDIEIDSGIKALVRSTIHLYDSEGNVSSVKSDIAYSTLQDISKDNDSVKMCGDLSLYWLLDLKINTSKTLLYKYGFTKTFNILDEDNQIFNNLHHIENGHFVSKCTRKSNKIKTNNNVNVNANDKIVLSMYSKVINAGDNYDIEIKSLPTNYSYTDIRYESEDCKVASIKSGQVKAITPGNTRIHIYTSDNKYHAYINILVSTG